MEIDKSSSMPRFLNSAVKAYLRFAYSRLVIDQEHPERTQQKVFERLLANTRNTKYGRQHSLHKVKTLSEFRSALPLVCYDDIKPYIHRMMMGEADVLVGGTVRNFSKSSGTTSEVSKFIPVPRQNMSINHIKGGWDSLALFYHKMPSAEIFHRKSLLIAGTVKKFTENHRTSIGDISALMAANMPAIGRPFFAPDVQTALLADWHQKIDKTTKAVAYEDLVMIGGVPTWLIVLFKSILDYTGKSNMLEVWPHLQGYFHGGVGFDPYKAQFQKYIPSADFLYHEIYNSSEGYFAAQDHLAEAGMMLLINNGIVFEFMESSQWDKPNPEVLSLLEVKPAVPYALVISSNNGLMRYRVGDVIEFSSVRPYHMKVTGRTSHYINVFGEEVMVKNTDRAIGQACEVFGATISDYTVAPVFMSDRERGGHEWLIEFDRKPADIPTFAARLDQFLREANSDYDAKRTDDLALLPLKLVSIPKGSFHKWLEKKDKIGAQYKVPRLSNDRKILEEILDLSFVKSFS